MMARILIVADEKSIRGTLGEFLRAEGYEVIEAEDADGARQRMREAEFDVVVSDIILPRINGVELLRHIQATDPRVQVVMMTGESTVETATDLLRASTADYVIKPVGKAAILRAVANAARLKSLEDTQRRLEAENRGHRENLERLVGERTAQLSASEERYRTLVDTARDTIFTISPAGLLTSISAQFSAVFGWRREEWLGRSFEQLIHADDLPLARSLFTRALRGEQLPIFELRVQTSNGGCVPTEFNAAPRSEKGRVVETLGVARDVTERKAAEARLRESEALYQSLVENVPQHIFRKDAAGRFTFGNGAFCRSVGLPLAAILGKTDLDFCPPELAEQYRRDDQRVIETGQPFQGEEQYREADGRMVLVHIIKTPLRNAAGQTIGVQAISWDITERKRTEQRLREYERVVEGLQEMIVVVDREYRYVLANPAFLKYRGLEWGQLEGRLVSDITPKEVFENVVKKKLDECLLGKPVRYELRYDYPHLGARDLSIAYLPIEGPTGIDRVACVLEDITERKLSEENNARLATAVEQAAEVVIITDLSGTILYVNPAFEKTTGYTRQEAIGQNPRLLKSGKHDAEFYRQMWSSLARGEVWHGHFINQRKDGTLCEEEATISPIRNLEGKTTSYVAVKRDVTEQLQHERLARRSQRLESLGTLAGGIAHDLNNALAPIMMGVELIKMQYPEESEIIEMFQTSAKRGADMVRQLLTFAKGAEGERVAIQPNHLVKELHNMMKGSFPKNIQLVVKGDPKLPLVLGDATQLHQILLNLCVNARDAMPHGGTLTLEAESQQVDAVYASTIPDAKPGHFVVLRVRDTGTGIPPEIMDRIFDPFFTTKGPDQGTGLGLSTTLGIVKGHGGFLQVYSRPDQGTTFTVYLPAVRPGSDTELVAKAAVEFRGQGETILFVDDEPSIRDVARAVLRRLNFTPLTAPDGTEGLIQVAEHRTELRAVITDLHMPHMDGLEFVRTLRRMLPTIPVLVASGRMEDTVVREFEALGVTSRLDKPFTEIQLAEALENLLAPKLTGDSQEIFTTS